MVMNFQEIKGAIFDVDDTLLDNCPGDSGFGLHEYSRFLAAREIGERHNLPRLQNLTEQQSIEAYWAAPIHGMAAAIWQMLLMIGEVHSAEIDHNHSLFLEIIQLQGELHKDVLRTRGQEVPGATRFVRTLGARGLREKLAIASAARRSEIDTFLEMVDLTDFFPDARIISRESITYAKPHPEAFDLAFKTLDLAEQKRRNVVAFEDHPRGIASAKQAGLYVCGITTCFSREKLVALEFPPDLIADSFAEFELIFGLSDHQELAA